jgi:hypothetical protein
MFVSKTIYNKPYTKTNFFIYKNEQKKWKVKQKSKRKERKKLLIGKKTH